MAKREIIKNDLATVRVDEGVTDAIEHAVDVVESGIDHTVETVEKIVTVTKNNPLILAGVLIVGAGLGGFVGYKIAVKRLTDKYETLIESEIAKSRTFYKKMAKEDEFESPESAVQALVPDEVVDTVKTYQGRKEPRVQYNKPSEIVEAEVKIETRTVNVFTEGKLDPPRGWDYDFELAQRAEKPDEPYVISVDEFNEGEESYDKTNLTFYEADDTLVDERDTPIDTVDYTVGEDNLTKFGHGSGDHNVVYIRNEKIGTDFEVIRSKGSYSHEVLGLDPEPSRNLRHSSSRRGRRKFDED